MSRSGGRGSVRRPLTMMPSTWRLSRVRTWRTSRAGSSRVSQKTMLSSPNVSASSAPSSSGMLNLPKLSVVSSPTEKLRPVGSERASWLGRKSSSSAAATTRSRVEALTSLRPLRALETVDTDTPACSATSLIRTGMRRRGG